MGSKKKIGVRIDEDLWEAFKQHIQDKYGMTRGVTGRELETAIRNYINAEHPSDELARIENELSHVNKNVAEIREHLVEADGGSIRADSTTPPTPSTGRSHTHTDSGTIAEPNDPTDEIRAEVEDEFDALEAGHPSNQSDDTDEDDEDDEPTKPHQKGTKAAKADWFIPHGVPLNPITATLPTFELWADEAWGMGDRATEDLLRRVFDKYPTVVVKNDKGSIEVVVGTSKDEVDERTDEVVDDGGKILHDYDDAYDAAKPSKKKKKEKAAWARDK